VQPVFLLANAFGIKATDIGLPTGTQDLGQAFSNTTNLLIYLIGGLSIIFIIVGGLQMVLSNGDPKRFAQGRETIIYAAVGVAVAIASYAIVGLITSKV
jgi:hypothetical protein